MIRCLKIIVDQKENASLDLEHSASIQKNGLEHSASIQTLQPMRRIDMQHVQMRHAKYFIKEKPSTELGRNTDGSSTLRSVFVLSQCTCVQFEADR
jgi:hypothetical protein